MGWPTKVDVPILGQSFKVVLTFSTAVIECQCEAKKMLVLHKGVGSKCPACNRTFGIASVGAMQVGEVVRPAAVEN